MDFEEEAIDKIPFLPLQRLAMFLAHLASSKKISYFFNNCRDSSVPVLSFLGLKSLDYVSKTSFLFLIFLLK